jgi:hypothetical protein
MLVGARRIFVSKYLGNMHKIDSVLFLQIVYFFRCGEELYFLTEEQISKLVIDCIESTIRKGWRSNISARRCSEEDAGDLSL